MKRWKKLLLGGLVVVVVAGAGTAMHFQNELEALRYFVQYTPEQQVALEEENEQALEQALQKANLPAALFADSSLSAEELQQKLAEYVQQGTLAQNTVALEQQANGSEKTTTEQNGATTVSGQAYDAELASMVGEIYALRSSFVGQLDGLLQQAKNEYKSLSPEERDRQKSALVSKYVGLAGSLESSCDGQMNRILSRMQQHLKETGGDTSLIKEIRKVYEKEKALKKSYYMSLMRS